MSVKKTKETIIDELKAKNAELDKDNQDLRIQCELFMDQVIAADKRRIEEYEFRRDIQRENEELKIRLRCKSVQLDAANSLRASRKQKRMASVPKFVIIAAAALVAFIVTMELQKLSIIGPAVGFGIQCGAAMVIAWCYAIIWDRSRK